MRTRPTQRTFAAFVERTGIFLVEYRRGSDRIDILDRTAFEEELSDTDHAASELGRMLRTVGGERAKLNVTFRGFGTCHHILVLPQAKPELLRPVVTREMQRLYPDLTDPIVDFVAGDTLDRRARIRPDTGTPPRELLAAAIPRADMDRVAEILARDEIELQHFTVVPRVLQRMYAEVASPEAPSVVLMLLNSGPIFGFFYDSQLRLVVEPPVEDDVREVSADFVIEQLERGNLYLRQQFRGAQISRLLLAAEPGEFGPLSRAVEDRMGLVVERFGSQIGSSSAIAAMGSVLDAADGNGLNLFRARETEKKGVDKNTRRITMASVIMLAVISWWWAGNGVAAVRTWRQRNVALTSALERRAEPLQPLRQVVVKRQQAIAQHTSVQDVAAERGKLQQLLQALGIAAASGVTVNSFHAQRDAAGWTATVSGDAASYTASDAVASVHRFYRELPAFVQASAISLDSLTWTAPPTDGQITRIVFKLGFTAPAGLNLSATGTVPR